MRLRNKIQIVLVFALATSIVAGCCMKRDIAAVDAKINRIRADQQQLKESVIRLDSLLYADANESVKLRAEIRSTLGDVMEQFQMLQANFDDVQNKLNYMAEQGRSVRITPQTTPTDTADTTAAVMAGINCEELYDESFINIRGGHYEEAIQGFTDYLRYCGMQDMADNARFWIGESYYSMDNFRSSIDEFEKLLEDYPNSEKRQGAYYKMARSYEELGQKSDAKATFQKLVDEFPGTLEAEQAKEKLKEF